MSITEVILSGKSSYSIEVPYRLYRTGNEEKQKQPLFVYLHENGRNLADTEMKTGPLRTLPGYHLLIQAPYPDISEKKGKRGYHWIPLYSDETSVTAAREHVSEFLQEIIDGLLPHINGNRLVLVGWEGSRHQISYFCATRAHYINEIVLFEGSVNRTWMEEDTGKYRHIRVLGLSGKDADISADTAATIYQWLHGKEMPKK